MFTVDCHRLLTYSLCPSVQCLGVLFGSWILFGHLTILLRRSGALPSNYVHAWTLCSDNGTDQLAFRNQLKTLMVEDKYSNQLVWDTPCLKHQLHLLTHDSIKLATQLHSSCGMKCGYFAALSKVCHTWRAHGAKVAKVWQTIVPGGFKYRASCSVPPLAIAGRWGSVDCH